MSDNIRTDSIDLICTKEDFVELMDDNAKLCEQVKELKAENKQLQAQVEALQNKCAQRGLAPEDSDRLQARNEQLEELLHEMLQWCEAYPEDIFTPLQGDPIKETGDYDTEEKRNLITRASASMGRYILKKWPEKIRDALET